MRAAARPAAAVSLLTALLLGIAALIATPAGAAPAAASSASPAPGDDGVVVVLGTAGLTWDDVTPDSTMGRWSGQLAQLVVRSAREVGCPVDGWLTISAGQRAADDAPCGPIAATGSDHRVPGWDHWATLADDGVYDGAPGALGDRLAEAHVRATAIGPGAAIALARSDGTVRGSGDSGAASGKTDPSTTAAAVMKAIESGSRLVIADLGAVDAPAGSTQRADQVAAVDAAVEAVLASTTETGTAATVWVTSVADTGDTAALRLVARTSTGSGSETPGLLRSSSTRQVGLLVLTDVTTAVLAELGIPEAWPDGTDPFIGGSVTAVAAADPRGVVDDIDLHATVVHRLYPVWAAMLSIATGGCLLVAALGMRRVRPGVAAVIFAAAGSLPAAAVLTNIAPWWRSPAPVLTAVGVVLAVTAVLTLLSWAPGLRRWTGDGRATLLLLAGSVALLLLVDATTGGRLQLSGLVGSPPTVGGRYYGIHNQGFAFLGAASLLVAATVAGPLAARGRRLLAIVVVAVIGAVVTLVDGAAALGADFGGPPSLVPAFALLALVVAGIRLRRYHVATILAAAAAATTVLALADWLRPSDQRSHLGRFVATLLAGDGWRTIDRKFSQNVGMLGGALPTLATLAAMAAVGVLLARAVKRDEAGTGPLAGWRQTHPMLGPGATAVVVFAAVGYAVNDSGPVVPALAGYVALTAGGAALCRWAADEAPVSPPTAASATDA